jgi:hypothetical protein
LVGAKNTGSLTIQKDGITFKCTFWSVFYMCTFLAGNIKVSRLALGEDIWSSSGHPRSST